MLGTCCHRNLTRYVLRAVFCLSIPLSTTFFHPLFHALYIFLSHTAFLYASPSPVTFSFVIILSLCLYFFFSSISYTDKFSSPSCLALRFSANFFLLLHVSYCRPVYLYTSLFLTLCLSLSLSLSVFSLPVSLCLCLSVFAYFLVFYENKFYFCAFCGLESLKLEGSTAVYYSRLLRSD